MISATIFLSAFLLFLVQPIIAKLILPRFGGGVAVWATCLVFFQVALLLGYAYAHQLVRARRCRPRCSRLHIALLLASLLVLPIIPGDALAACGSQANPSAQIAAACWWPRSACRSRCWPPPARCCRPGWRAPASRRDPYRLFVVSNLASLFALVCVPVADRAVARHHHAGTRVVGAAMRCTSRWRSPWPWRTRGARADPTPARPPASDPPPPLRALGIARPLGWVALAALASYELVAVTNHLTQNVPSMPLMWVLPLGALPAHVHAVLRRRSLVPAGAVPRRRADRGAGRCAGCCTTSTRCTASRCKRASSSSACSSCACSATANWRAAGRRRCS